MTTVQLPVSKRLDTQVEVHTETQNTDVILTQEFQKKNQMNQRNVVLQIT